VTADGSAAVSAPTLRSSQPPLLPGSLSGSQSAEVRAPALPESEPAPLAQTAGNWRMTAVQLVLVALLAVPALVAVGGLFDGLAYLPPLAGAVLVAAPLGAVAAYRLADLGLVGVVGLVGGLTYGAAATAGAVLRDLGAGWPHLLSVALPAQPSALLLTPPAALLWVGTYCAAVLVVRGRPPLAPVAPPLGALVAVLVLVGGAGAGSSRARLLATGGFVAAALALAAVRASLPAESAGRTRGGDQVVARGGGRGAGALSVGLPVVALIAAVGTVAATLVPAGGARYDPREHWHRPVDDVAVLSPLVQVRGQLATTPPRTLFTVRIAAGTGRLPVDRIRVAALGDFDGAAWQDDGQFVRVERALPAPADQVSVTVAQTAVRADVTVTGLDGVLLPSLGRPTALRVRARPGAGAAYQPASGTLATLGAVPDGYRYELASYVAIPTEARLAAATPATGPAAAPSLGLPPGLPPELVSLAAAVTASAPSPYAKLVALQGYLRDGSRFPYDLAATPGHSYGALTRFLTGRGAGDQRGYSEQHAAAFAVLARALGFATRVSVGYLLDRGRLSADDTFTVTTQQAHAWPEVLLSGLGWVPFEPTDDSQLTKVLPPPAETSPDALTGVSAGRRDATSAQVVPPLRVPPVGATTDGTRPHASDLLWLWVLLSVAALVVALPLLVVAEKARRRRRRRRGDPGARVIGAWGEARDRLAEHGVSRATTLTQQEVVALVAGRPTISGAAAPLSRLATLTDRAMFAPVGDENEPDEAWGLVGDLRRELLAGRGRGWALVRAADLRPLLPAPSAWSR
jgi:transglutaminase-like putative cysteine protease